MMWVRNHVYTIVIFFFVFASFFPALYELSRAGDVHPDRQFELVHNYYTDYNFYLSRIRQGIEGSLTVHEKYTSEPHKGSLFQIFYLALGWVGDFLSVPWDRPGDIYHVARIVFAFPVLFLIAEYAKTTLKKISSSAWAFIAFLLAVTASTWPKLVLSFDGWRFGGYLPWFTVMDSLQRITFIPHLLAGQALIMFLILALSDRATMAKPGNWIFLGILGFILGIIYPPGLLLVGAAAFFLFLFDRIFLGRLTVGFMSAPALLYLYLMTMIYPWHRLVEYDLLHPQSFPLWEYMLAVGPVLPLGILGMIVAAVRKESSLKPVAAWALAFFTLFTIFHFVPEQNPSRFAEMLPHVPLAIFSVYFFSTLSDVSTLGKILAKIIAVVVILLGLGVMYSSWLWQRDFTDHKIEATLPLVPFDSYVMYPLKDFIAGMTYLRGNTPRDSVVLSMQTTGNYIPVYAGNTVYFGHANTVKYEQKQVLVQSFFAGGMKPDEGRAWLHTAGISYVFYGPQEEAVGNITDLSSRYAFLVPVYSNHYVTIFRVQ